MLTNLKLRFNGRWVKPSNSLALVKFELRVFIHEAIDLEFKSITPEIIYSSGYVPKMWPIREEKYPLITFVPQKCVDFILCNESTVSPLVSFRTKERFSKKIIKLLKVQRWTKFYKKWIFVNSVWTETINVAPTLNSLVCFEEQNLSLVSLFDFEFDESNNIIKRLNYNLKLNSDIPLKAFFENCNLIHKDLCNIKFQLESIGVFSGYVEDINIFNFPVVGEIASLFMTETYYKNISYKAKANVYNWLSNILCLNMFTVCNRVLSVFEEIQENVSYRDHIWEFYLDIKTKFKVFKHWCHSLIDNSLKQFLLRRNPLMIKDVYTGFDTEFVNLDFGKNLLVSIQLAITKGIKLKVPFAKPFVYEGVNTLSSETYLRSAPQIQNLEEFTRFIESFICENRRILFKNHDKNMINIINHFIMNNKNIDNFNKVEDAYIFQFKKSPIVYKAILKKDKELLKVKMEQLVTIINDSVDFKTEEDTLKSSLNSLNLDKYDRLLETTEKVSFPWNAQTLEDNYIFVWKDGWTKEKVIDIVSHPDPTPHLDSEEFLDDSQVSKEFSPNPSSPEEVFSENSAIAEFSVKNSERKFPLEISTSERIFPENCAKAPGEILLEEEERATAPVLPPIRSRQNHYLISHFNAADLTLIEDWKEISDKSVDILKKSYCTLRSPIKIGKNNIFIRDSLLLSSAAASSLEAVGKAHGLPKGKLNTYQTRNMDTFLTDHPAEFLNYAMQDSLITLTHALFMNDFNFRLGSMNLPNTLGSITNLYLKNKWKLDKYKGYQLNAKYLLGDIQNSITPKGVRTVGFPLEVGNLYLASFRGGRNECFSYGVDKTTRWYDYDLTSCYSTIMSMCGHPSLEEQELEDNLNVASNILPSLGHPNYSKGEFIHPNNFKRDYKKGYGVLKVKFHFPEVIKFPPIPVTMDENITVYPLMGESVITGLEFECAKNILYKSLKLLANARHYPGVWEDLTKKYYISVISGAYIPFKEDIKKDDVVVDEAYNPFYNIINELQENRRKHPKKSAMERIYKDLGNMLYGKVVCGISNKRSFDSRLLQMKAMSGNYVTNPIIGSWITGFVRALIAELLFEVQKLGGKVTAVTTDGFVTNIKDLEEKVVANLLKDGSYEKSFIKSYRDIRCLLSKKPESEALEIKTSVRGIVQWTTRGQLSLNHTDEDLNNFGISIAAMTGFQKHRFSQEENISNVLRALNHGNKILFYQTSLSGALDFLKFENKVHMKSLLRKFKTVFDSKRKIVLSEKTMLETKPFFNADEALLTRDIMNKYRSSIYSAKYSRKLIPTPVTASMESIFYFARMALSTLDFKATLNEKLNLAWIINSALSRKRPFSDEFILLLLNEIENNPGKILNKFSYYRASAETVKNLYDSIFNKRCLFNTIEFNKKFVDWFSEYNLPTYAFALVPVSQVFDDVVVIDPMEFIISKLKDNNFKVLQTEKGLEIVFK